MDPDSTSNIKGSAATAVLFSLAPSDVEKLIGPVILTSAGDNANGASIAAGWVLACAAPNNRLNCSFVRTTVDPAGTAGSDLALGRLQLIDIETLFPFAQRKRVGIHYICESTALRLKASRVNFIFILF